MSGTFTGMKEDTILGTKGGARREFGAAGPQLRRGRPGGVFHHRLQHVLVSPFRLYAQGGNANPNGPGAGTSFFGEPADTRP